MTYRLGLDIGIASVGYAVLHTDRRGRPYKIARCNSVIFPKGENPKNGQSLAAARRGYRSGRRLTRRRKYRKHRVRRLFINHHLLTPGQVQRVFRQAPLPSVYHLRTAGLERRLTPPELFQVLYYFAGHRGFKSNRKYALNSKNTGPLLKSIQQAQEHLKEKGYSTVGEMLDKDPEFTAQKRNHDYDDGYHLMMSRAMVNAEAEHILREQIGQHAVSEQFARSYLDILGSQRNFDEGPGEPSPYAGDQIDKMIGNDTLDPRFQRGAKGTYTFEYFRLLSDLNQLRYKFSTGHTWYYLNQAQRKKLVRLAFQRKKVNFYQVKRCLGFTFGTKFNLVRYHLYKKPQTAERHTEFCELRAIHEISKCIGMSHPKPTLIDQIGEILSKYSSDSVRTKYFHAYLGKLSDGTISKLLNLNYSTFGDLSLHTMRNIIPYLEKGYLYNEATTRAGYDFKHRPVSAESVQENVKNPVVQRAFRMARKVVQAVLRRYGKPDAINIELARDLAKSFRDRMNIQRNNKRHQKMNDRTEEQLRELGIPVNGQNIIINNLYHEQGGIDPYTGRKMNYLKVFNGSGNYYNIDHIIPYSWSFDDSYTNKVLTSTKANEEKGNHTPLQFLADDKERKVRFVKFAKKNIKNYRKRKHLLTIIKNPSQLAKLKQGWKQRNLNDTRYLNRLIANYLKQNVPFRPSKALGKQRVVSLNGSITAKMRARWGIKKYYPGHVHRYFGDLNHAVDATVIACVTPSFIKRINDFSRYQETNGRTHLDNSKAYANDFPIPWHDFRDELYGRVSPCPSKAMSSRKWDHYTHEEIKLLQPVFTVHVDKHSVNGQATKDTMFSAKYLKNGLLMKRFPVNDLKLNAKGEIKHGRWTYRAQKDHGDKETTAHLLHRLSAHNGSGKKAFPDGKLEFHDANGHLFTVRHVKMFAKAGPGVLTSDRQSVKQRGKIVRIDVFYNKRRGYRFVPVSLNDTVKAELPDTISGAGKKKKHLTRNDSFQFSLYHYTPVHIVFSHPRNMKNVVTKKFTQTTDFYGYYVNPGRGSINLVSMDRIYYLESVGISRLKKFQKLDINYLGEVHPIRHERRLPFAPGN